MAIPKRALREDTCRKYGYKINVAEGCHIEDYRDDTGAVIAQHIRMAGKKFRWIGDASSAGLFGQHLFNSGKTVVITEGAIDCMSVSQAFGNKYPVVSLKGGAQGAVKDIEQAYEWLGNFEEIKLCFDDDAPGREATAKVSALLPHGKVFNMKLARKDAGEVLVNDGTAPIVSAFWNAVPWRPEGIVMGSDMTLAALKKRVTPGFSLPFPKLTQMSRGIRMGEITMLAAGSGVGKSSFARELAYHLHQAHGLTIANVYLEESKERTAQGYVALHNDIPLGDLAVNPELLTDEQWNISMKECIADRMIFYDHFGSLDSKVLLDKMRYMRLVLNVDFIVLDHISIVISGNNSSTEGERRDIDVLMTRLATLAEGTGVGIIAIVHLNSPDGKPHEEGGRVTLNNLRGSGALKQLSHNVLALERDQQGETSNEVQLRLLKNRLFGTVGPADILAYNTETGRMKETAVSAFANTEL